ncbi:hypothetical protein [Paracoccus hibiscisoli]|uniref:Uncharacterized protein n=1 Tax=Paracoccus hibiscisoli TaxID=2023261 RepID=A0A4U0QTX3_9RHOB|nr:hypothetical protein [Paracoccus hibiscisoli]TJZ85100.1 hypothetical protein FA740_07085 [Paracoccus hibiscisoli]
MTRWTALMIAAATALTQPALAQTSDGVPGDRVVVPLPDVSGLSDDAAQALAHDLAQMTVITAECPEHDVSGPEFQLMAGTTDALTERLGLDPVSYDRDYVRPAFSVMSEADACDRLGPQVPEMIARLEGMGGSTQPVTPGLAEAAAAEAAADADTGTDAPAQ